MGAVPWAALEWMMGTACRWPAGREPSGLPWRRPRQRRVVVIVRIVFSWSWGDHDAWRGRPGTARFSDW